MQEKCRQYSTALKLKCIMEREVGKSYSQIRRENNVHYTTVMKWCRQAQQGSAGASPRWAGKDKIFKSDYDGGQEPTVILEDFMPRKVNVEDLKKENEALKEDLSYYRHKTAYLETLNEVLLEKAEEEASKKKDSKQ